MFILLSYLSSFLLLLLVGKNVGKVKFCTNQRQRYAAAVVLDSAKITRKLSSRIVAVCWLCGVELSIYFARVFRIGLSAS